MRANQSGKRLPTFNFLGFTCYWGKTRKGHWRLKLSSRKDRFAAKLKGLRDFLWRNLNAPNKRLVLNTIIRVIRGWINYHCISDNQRRVRQFIFQSTRIIYRWFNRKGVRRRMTWKTLNIILKCWVFHRDGKPVHCSLLAEMCVGTLICRESDAVVPHVRFCGGARPGDRRVYSPIP